LWNDFFCFLLIIKFLFVSMHMIGNIFCFVFIILYFFLYNFVTIFIDIENRFQALFITPTLSLHKNNNWSYSYHYRYRWHYSCTYTNTIRRFHFERVRWVIFFQKVSTSLKHTTSRVVTAWRRAVSDLRLLYTLSPSIFFSRFLIYRVLSCFHLYTRPIRDKRADQ